MLETSQKKEFGRLEDSARMKMLSLKILTSCWTNEYAQAQQFAYLPVEKMPINFPKINMSCCLARKQVAESVQALMLNNESCDTDIFLPLLSLRCQKEISVFQRRLAEKDDRLDRDYYEAIHAAWEHILKIVQK